MGSRLGTQVGSLVRLRREQRGMSAAELARQADISKASLSGIESGRGNPTLDTLDAIALALAVPLVDLLDLGNGPASIVVRAKPLGPEPVSQQLMHRLGGGHGLETWRLRLAARQTYQGVPHATGTIEQVLVTTGRLTAGHDDDPHTLGPGDLIAFAGDRPHTYLAHDDAVEALVLIATPGT